MPVTLGDAVTAALEQGPQYRQARAAERQARSQIKAIHSNYFPTLTLTAANQTFDSKFFPTGANTSQVALVVAIPIWNLGVRETQATAARVTATIAEAVRRDLERGAYRDVLEAHGGYDTQRRIVSLADQAVAAARENYRVQDLRYRGGATTILDLLDAQFRLAQAEGDAVQARFAARLALASLEAILGRRLLQP
jgi:outer membrane protein TolC